MEDGMNVYMCVDGDESEYIAAKTMSEALEKYKATHGFEPDLISETADDVTV